MSTTPQSEVRKPQTPCRHCLSMHGSHERVCRCGHTHNDHIYGGGCKICPPEHGCDQYDQSHYAYGNSEVSELIEVPKLKGVKKHRPDSLDLTTLEQKLLEGSEITKELSAAQSRVEILKEKLQTKASSS